MATHMHHAQEILFGMSGLGASNFKMFPGHNRETTPDQVAEQIVLALTEAQNDEDVIA